jgi:hypothetical protein
MYVSWPSIYGLAVVYWADPKDYMNSRCEETVAAIRLEAPVMLNMRMELPYHYHVHFQTSS